MTTRSSFTFCMHGLTAREGDVVELFLDRALAQAAQLNRPFDIDEDGMPILAALIDEMLPDYTIEQAIGFTVNVLDQIETVLDLNRYVAEGAA